MSDSPYTLWRGIPLEALTRAELLEALNQSLRQNGELRAEIDRLHRERQA